MRNAIDFSVLDALTENKIPAVENVPQVTQTTVQIIQQFKRDISQGVKAGAEPYPLLLMAIQAIAAVTNDRTFFTVCCDVMQGMGMLGHMPPEWERDSAETSLRRLEEAQRNIDTAITAHKKKLLVSPLTPRRMLETNTTSE